MKRLTTTSKQRRALPGLLWLLLAFLPLVAVQAQGQGNLWKEVSGAAVITKGTRHVNPQLYRNVALDVSSLRQVLLQAPTGKNLTPHTSAAIITLPLPGGGFARFRFVEVPVMAPELAARFPEIRTYSGVGVDDPSLTAAFDLTPAGFHGMIHSPDKGLSFIDPYNLGNTKNYIVYAKKDYRADKQFREAGLRGENSARAQQVAKMVAEKRAAHQANPTSSAVARPSGDQLRTYRLAVAATAEYTAFHGGTVAQGLAAINTTLNRINFIFIRELAIRMLLVGNNNTIIYTNPATDPYTNGDAGAMLGEVQTDIDAKIGPANYDIGHVFGTNSGGVAYLGVVCFNGYKAGGVTGSGAPIGDAFDVDYVAHEMGHQFGANHTFNGTDGACGGGNRNAETAYEPGSGSTIMAYAGICGDHDLQSNSDAYFHTVSYDEIFFYTELDDGNDCAQITNTGNHPPVPTIVTPSGLTIPKSTPFTITGSATDPDGDPITYNWEQYDLGPGGEPQAPVGNAPIFRSFPATSSPSRTFPRLSDILNNTTTIGEVLPTYARAITFNLTVRDNRAIGGGVDWAYPLTIQVSAAAGPFVVTAPNTAVSYAGGSSQTIAWDVANTNLVPVNCAHVNIRLSTDGGLTFPTVLAANTPNDGSQSVALPNVNTTTARIKIEAVGNIFFDISNTNFTINAAPAGPQVQSFRLINASNEQEIQTISNGAVINLATLPSRNLNIRAITNPAKVGSVKFALTGTVNKTATENDPPYALYGDVNGNYNAWKTPPGNYTLTARAYTGANGGGTAGEPLIISFQVVDQPQPLQVLSFSLINAKTNTVIGTLNDGDEINMATLPSRNVNIRANTSPATVGSVKFALTGREKKNTIENEAPYALYGDHGGDYNDWYLQKTGNYTLKATPYAKSNAQGTAGTALIVNFRVVNQASAPVAAREAASLGATAKGRLAIYPNPTEGKVQVQLPAAVQGPVRYTLESAWGKQIASGTYDLARPASLLELDLTEQMRLPGIYYLRLEGTNVRNVVRLMRR